MTAAFACKFCIKFMELGFDIGVTGLPHHGCTAVCIDNVFKSLGAFYVVNNLRAGFLFEKLFCEERKNDITPYVLTLFVDDTDTVAVAVEGKTDVRMNVRMTEHIAQTFSAFKLGGVGEVVREGGIGIAVELEGHTAEALEYFVNEETCTAVCGIKSNADLLGTHVDTGNDCFDVSISYVNFLVFTSFTVCMEVEEGVNFENVVGFESFGVAVCKLEAGPTVGVVARCDHNGAFTLEVVLRKISYGGEGKTCEENVNAVIKECFRCRFTESGGAGAAIVANYRACDISSFEVLRVSAYDFVNVFIRKLFGANLAANVVFTEHAAEREGVFVVDNHNIKPFRFIFRGW
jgi:hypothetical protein